MAIRPDYTVGTITLTANSPNFTTSGSALQAAAVQAGDEIITRSGNVLIIASITGQNAGTLMQPCPTAAAGAGQPLRIRFQPDGSRYQGAVRDLVDKLANGVLENIASTPVQDGKTLVGNASGQYEPRDYIADPNGSLGKLAALTMAANKALTTNANGDLDQINLGTLGRALLALATGTSAQYVQGDGTLQAKTGLPISTATQAALDAKANTAGPTLTGTTTAVLLRVGQGTQQGRISFNNTNGVYVAEMGPGVGTGEANRVGFYSIVNAGWWFGGAVQVTGALSKGSGTFLIDHPLDPYNRNLRHGFVEAPRYDLIYRGTVRLVAGRATVDIDAASNMSAGTFAALTTNAVVTSLQNQDGFARLRPGPIDGGSFEIICEDDTCADHVSWVVIAERNDPFVKSDLDPNTDSDGRFVPEFDKEDA